MGGLFAYLAAEATTALKRRATVYGLMAVGGLILLFAAGYVLNAGYMLLVFRMGSTAASLIVACGLLISALACVTAGIVVQWRSMRPRSSGTLASSPYSYAPHRRPYTSKRVVAVTIVAAGAMSAGFVLLNSEVLRNILRRSRRSS